MTSPYKTETRHHPLGKTCHHFTYHRLTCDEYDALCARAAGRCEICGIAEEDTPRGALVIDHFRGRRTSVTRGLLCDRCNTSVMQCIDGNKIWGPRVREFEARAREYERNSWHAPSEAARQEMAARTEMLSRFDPRYESPSYEPARLEHVPAVPASIQLPLRQGMAAIARKLRKNLSDQQMARLVALLTADEG